MTAALEWTPADGSLIVVPDRRKHPCSRCGGPRNVPGQAYCRNCHNEYQKEYRKWQTMELTMLRAGLAPPPFRKPKCFMSKESFVIKPEMAGQTRQIVLTGGKTTTVDAEDYEWLNQWKWHCSAHGYATRSGEGNTVQMSRFILSPDSDLEVDHIDRNRLNNTRANLRIATNSQNAINIAPTYRNTSGFKGVSLDKKTGQWRSMIRIKGEHAWLGRHDTAEDAARAYDAKARELFGEFAYLNFPQEVTT